MRKKYFKLSFYLNVHAGVLRARFNDKLEAVGSRRCQRRQQVLLQHHIVSACPSVGMIYIRNPTSHLFCLFLALWKLNSLGSAIENFILFFICLLDNKVNFVVFSAILFLEIRFVKMLQQYFLFANFDLYEHYNLFINNYIKLFSRTLSLKF